MGAFLWLSDFHLDPYYGTPHAASASQNSICSQTSTLQQFPFGHVGCDASPGLMKEVLLHLASSTDVANIDFVLVTGDFSRHATDQLDDSVPATQSILSTVAEALKETFPSIPIIPCIGNNDVFPDYTVDLEVSGTENAILNISLRGFKSLFDSQESLETFSKGGYFARNVADSLTILSLNTVMYSINHLPDQTYLDDPMGQLAWLREQLESASTAGGSVYIVGHIPPTIGSYRHSQFWHDKYMDLYFDVLRDYQDTVVKGHLFGHLHSDEFRFLRPFSSSLAVPLYIAPSVTPVYGSNPSYRLVQYDNRTSELLDYQTYYLDLQTLHHHMNTSNDTAAVGFEAIWTSEGPGFVTTYDLKNMSTQSLQALIARLTQPLVSSRRIWQAFLDRQYVSSTDQELCDDFCRTDWLCTLQATSKGDYDACVLNSTRIKLQRDRLLMAPSITFGIVLAGFLALGCRRYFKRRHFLKVGQYDESHLNGVVQRDTETCARTARGAEINNVERGEMT
ncbi:calcineurin-like phosphoesterase [Nitzschia inconspicua]|uniref:Calcineurin-like phosphoesterase n=1 Tax=Nitzschia inconspicua TaxID=303405 RepID=A0A9K3PBI3_9STRA|nr:calcineurin-like phosphoesterase [Nitzschia inconspicua]